MHWHDVTLPKEHGELELRDAQLNNVAMLGKLVDIFLHEQHKSWVQALSQQYLVEKSILAGIYKNVDSYILKGISGAMELVCDGFHPQLGNDGSSIWYDDWLGSKKLCH